MSSPKIKSPEFPDASERDLKVILLYRSGLSVAETARAANVGNGTAGAVVRKYGISRSTKEAMKLTKGKRKSRTQSCASVLDKNEAAESEPYFKALNIMNRLYRDVKQLVQK